MIGNQNKVKNHILIGINKWTWAKSLTILSLIFLSIIFIKTAFHNFWVLTPIEECGIYKKTVSKLSAISKEGIYGLWICKNVRNGLYAQ